MTVLRIDSSIQGTRSSSSALADIVTAELLKARPHEALVSRHLAVDPIPADAWATAVGAARAQAALVRERPQSGVMCAALRGPAGTRAAPASPRGTRVSVAVT